MRKPLILIFTATLVVVPLLVDYQVAGSQQPVEDIVCGQWEITDRWVRFAYYPWSIENFWEYAGLFRLEAENGQYAVLYKPWIQNGELKGFAYMEIVNGCPSSISALPSYLERNPICGWLRIPHAGDPGFTGVWEPSFKPWGTEDIIDLMFLEGENADIIRSLDYWEAYISIYDPEFAYPGILGTFSRIERVDSCEPLPTPTPSPTPAPTIALPRLEVIDFEVKPSQVSVYEMVRIEMTIENKGTPLNQPYWGYSGEVVLEDRNGNVVERHSFAKGDASFISPVIENGQVNFEKWLLTVKVRFGTAVSNGKVIVSIQPDGQQSVLRGEGTLTVNVGISGLTCTSVVVNKLVGPFLSDIPKASLDGISAGVKAAGCKDGDFACVARPLVEGLVKVLGRATFDLVGKIIIGIWGVFDTDALQVCKDPVSWMWQLVREFNRQGVPISVSGSHSPVLILVTNSAGQRAGFVSEDEIVTELPDSQVVEWEGDKYVIYPADNNITISLRGTGNGTASLSLIDGQSGREVSYSSISVSDGTNAQLDLSDQQFHLVVDNNGDGNIDEAHTPESVEVLTQIETPTASPLPIKQPTGICGGTLGLTVLPFLALVVRRFRKGAK